MMRMSLQIRNYILGISLFFLWFLHEQQCKNWNLISFYPLLWHKNTACRYLYLNLETEITFASHPTGYTGSSMRPGLLFVLFRAQKNTWHTEGIVNIFQMNKECWRSKTNNLEEAALQTLAFPILALKPWVSKGNSRIKTHSVFHVTSFQITNIFLNNQSVQSSYSHITKNENCRLCSQ